MSVLFFLFLLSLTLALWGWLNERIWRISPGAATMSFFLIVPACYWCWKLWRDPDAQIRLPACAVALVTLPLVLMAYGIGGAGFDRFLYGDAVALLRHPELAEATPHGEMVAWCREKHRASYDPDLGTCVESAPSDPVAIAARDAAFAQLASYFRQHGSDGEFDATADTDDAALLAEGTITAAASYYFFPLSMQQEPIRLLLCSSNAACQEFQRSRGPTLQRNGSFLLQVAASSKDPRILQLQSAFARFRPS